MEVSDRIQVMRRGHRVATFATERTSMEELVGAMTGATDPEAGQNGHEAGVSS
jgi:simple sugar transport system ATP-binding protein